MPTESIEPPNIFLYQRTHDDLNGFAFLSLRARPGRARDSHDMLTQCGVRRRHDPFWFEDTRGLNNRAEKNEGYTTSGIGLADLRKRGGQPLSAMRAAGRPSRNFRVARCPAQAARRMHVAFIVRQGDVIFGARHQPRSLRSFSFDVIDQVTATKTVICSAEWATTIFII